MLPSSKGPPNRVERALAKAHLLKLDDPPASDANSGQPQRPRLDRHTFSSTESIQLAARAVRQRQGLPPDSDSDDDRSAPVDATKHTRPEHGDKPVPKNVIHKLRMPDVDKHPHWAKFNDAFQKAPPPLRFVGDTVGFVGNTALTVGMLPIELIVKGIRAGRNVSPETAAAIQKQSIAWDQVDPAFPEGYSTTFLGVDELDLQRAQQVHPVVTDENLPKMYPYPHGITAHEPGLISFKDAFFLIFAGMATAFFLLWYTLAATPSHFFYMLTRLVAMLLVTAVLLCLVALGRRRLLCEIESHRNAIHTARNESLVPSMPESVEWLNASIAALWNQIDPKLFVPLADQVEDVMQASLPKFVNAVKVDDVGIGINPFQLVALRSLRARTPDGREMSHSEDGNENPVPHSASSSGKGQEDASSPQVAERHEESTAAPSAGRNGEGHASHETSQSGPPQSSQLSGAGPERARPNQAPEPSQHLATDRDIKNPAPKQQDWPQLTEGPVNRRNEVDLDLPVQDEHALSQEDLQALTAANLCTKGESIRSKLRHRVLGKISGGEQGKDKDAADDDEQPNKSYQTASGSKRWAETKNQQPAGVSGTHDDPILDESTQEKEINVTDGAGGFVLLEASFSYSAAPKSPRSHNIHMMIQFFLGAMDMFQIPFPVWVQIEKIAGTLRLRAQLVSEPPYVRNLTFTLMGVPRIEVSVVPMVQNMGNILDIPLISNFVQSSIAAAANAYVAPQSMTLNVSEILSGDGVKKDTDTLGILAVHIDYARDLSSQDPNGYSDPYILVMLAKFGRPLYHTRIVRRDLNPVWNEYAFVLVTANDVKNEEQLSIQLWDWDRHSPDDIIGRVTRDVRQLMRRPNRWHRYTDGLRGFDEKTEMQGELTYEVGFFDKAPLGAPIIRSAGKSSKVNDVIQQVGGLDDLADHLRQQEDAELRSRSLMASRVQEISTDSEEVRQEKMALRQRREDRAKRNALALQASETMHRPPNPDYPTGVLSVLVESISGLENRDVERGYMGRAREGGAGQDIDNEQASKRIPSSYCEVLLNEEVWYSTRTKQYTNDPFFNAGIELMVRDWRTSNVTIVVRDARLREHDPIMGIVSLDLPDLFSSTSQVSRKFSLSDGVAFGKVQLSFIFRSMYIDLPRELRGSEVASLEILGPITFSFPPSKEVLERGGSAPVSQAGGGTYEDWQEKLSAGKLMITVGEITHFFSIAEYNPNSVERSVWARYAPDAMNWQSPKGGSSAPKGGDTSSSQGDVGPTPSGPSEANPVSLKTIPMFDRYMTNVIFGINPHIGIATLSPGRQCDAYATQWLGDVADCLPEGMKGAVTGGSLDEDMSKWPVTWVSIPIFAGPGAEVAAGNFVCPEAALTHKYGVVGEMRVGLRMRPGFDLSHSVLVDGRTTAHEWETYKRLRGMPQQAEINSHAADDGVIDRHERSAIRQAKREALHSRHRGSYGYGAVRTAVWAKDSLHSRVHSVKHKITGHAERDQMVMSEV